jgi:hypothetical protein
VQSGGGKLPALKFSKRIQVTNVFKQISEQRFAGKKFHFVASSGPVIFSF